MIGGPIPPGAYLRNMREAEGLTIVEVAALLEMLGLHRRSKPWFRWPIDTTLAKIEAGRIVPTDAQVLSLLLAFPFRVAEFRRLTAAHQQVGEA